MEIAELADENHDSATPAELGLTLPDYLDFDGWKKIGSG